MDADRFRTVKKILSSALELPEAERTAFLRRECGADSDLFQEVDSFLVHDETGHALFSDGRWIETEAPDELIGRVVSHYTILNRIGEGGMGIVYAAEDLNLKRRVALKFLPSSMMRDAAAKERFIREARAAAALDHPNICTVYEIVDLSGFLFIAMAYIDGETLAHILSKDVLPVHQCVEIAIQVANGLQAAHSKGVIHRDIKPGNIMITPAGVVKIMDFGLAKTMGCHDTTAPGKVMGTAAYMSPEQASGERTDHRSDLWSLGVVLYEMITGRRPFDAERQQAIIRRIVDEEPVGMSEIKSDIPVELERIVNRSLEKSISRRYQYAADMYRALSSFQRTLDMPATISSSVESLRDGSTGFSPLPTESTVSWVHRTARRASEKPRGFEVYSLSSLPAPLRGFIGRKDELEETKRLLKKNRLVTIYGIDGTGKSRLAIQSAAELVELFPDGTFFVSLAAVSTEEAFWRTLCDSMEIRLSGTTGEEQQLLDYMVHKVLLLILDDYDPTIHSQKYIELILDYSPGMKMMITSRNPLDIPAESVLQLAGMNYPDISDSDNPWASDAVRLYLQAVRSANPKMDLPRKEMNSVLCIVRHLYGIPLALELTAYWTRSMAVEKIPGMIRKLIGLRWWKRRKIPGPECIIPAILSKTWSMMPIALRETTLRLSIFRGGFRKPAAEELVENPEEDLGDLVRRSFLRKSRSGKYEMPGIIREFSRKRLRDRRVISTDAYHAYTRYYTGMLESARGGFRGSGHQKTLMVITDNILEIEHVFDTALRDHRSPILEKILPSLATFYDLKHWYSEAESRFTRASDELAGYVSQGNGETRHETIRILIQGERGVFRSRLGKTGESIDLLMESIEFLRETQIPSYLSYMLMNAGYVYERMGKYEVAYDSLHESLAMRREINDTVAVGYLNIALARISRAMGDSQGIEEYMGTFNGIVHDLQGKRDFSRACRRLCELGDIVELNSEWSERAGKILAILR